MPLKLTEKERTFTLDNSFDPKSILVFVKSRKKELMSNFYLEDNVIYEHFLFTKFNYVTNKWELHNNNSNNIYGFLIPEKNKIVFNFETNPIIDGEDNIMVEYIALNINKNIRIIKPISFNVINSNFFYNAYFEKGNEFLEKKEKLVLFSNSLSLPIYVPAENYIETYCNGIIPLSDDTFGLFTKNRTKLLQKTPITVGNEKKYTYKIYESMPGETTISEDSISILSNDPLFLSKNGVYSLKLGNNIKSNERYSIERSNVINNEFKGNKENILKKAKSIIFNNKYYLAINGKVYVADSRYKSTRKQDMDDTFNYEWWILENIYVKQWAILNNELYFISSKDNALCKFTDDRRDANMIQASKGSNLIGIIAKIETSDYLIQFNMDYLDYLKDGNEIINSLGNEYVICDVNKLNGTCKLKDKITKEYVYNNVITPNNNERIYIVNYTNVKAEWYSPYIDMGTNIYSKNLFSTTLTFDPNIEGRVKFGYLTKRNQSGIDKESNLDANNGVDFNNIDFNDFSFSTNFASSRTFKTKIRNFNFIQFRIISDNDKDFSLHHLTVLYNINRKNKGVR